MDDFKPLKNNHTGTILEQTSEPGYYVACNNCDVGAIPMWLNPEKMIAHGSCIMCGNKVAVKLIPPDHIIKYVDGKECIVPK